MKGLFKEVHQFYLSLKSHQNTRILVRSNFFALISFCMRTGSPEVQQTLKTFWKITFTSLNCRKFVSSRMFDIRY